MNRTGAHSWAGHVSSELCWVGVMGVMMLVVAGVHISAADHHNT